MAEFPNPYYAFIELWVGEVNITLLPPQHMQQFTYIRKPYNAANKFVIALFDETALLVEHELARGEQEIKFQYGYVNGTKSPVYSGIVQEYDTDFNPAGAVITIEGYSSATTTFSKPKSGKYGGGNNTIDVIVKQIADEEGWEYGIIEPCDPVSDGVNANKIFYRNNQVAQVFIYEELQEYAKNSKGSNFVLNFEDRDGVTYVNFYPMAQAPDLSESQTHTYHFRWGSGDKDNKVIDFNPDYSGTLRMMGGGAVVDSSTVDRLSNCMVNATFTSTSDPNRVVLADRSSYDYQGATRYIGGSAQSYDEMKKSAAYLWATYADYPVTAELTIVGDPLINAYDTISIVMLNKDGLPHHSSGVYCVFEIEDDIAGGAFITKMTLCRNASKIGKFSADGVDINLDMDYSITSTSDLYRTDDGSTNDASGDTSTGSGGAYATGSSNEQTIYNFLVQVMGFNCAAACGVLANIEKESSFRTDALGDSGSSYGICQWHDSRWTSLKNYCNQNGYDWESLEGQLYYLKYELETSESTALSHIKNVSNDAQGAYNAGYNWCYYFERPSKKSEKSVERGNLAKNTYYPRYKDYTPPEVVSTSAQSTTIPNGMSVNLHKLLLTNNQCYQVGRTITPKGIMVHSTGANNPNLKRYVGPDDGLLGKNQYNNHWNTYQPGGRQVCVHAFIGKLADGTIATYQTLPWNYRGWHAGGSANDTHIGFEICEDDLNDANYFTQVYNEAARLCAYLCKMYNLDPSADGVIIGHYEGYQRGVASNHGDPKNWFPKHGKSMDTFRADVAGILKGG